MSEFNQGARSGLSRRDVLRYGLAGTVAVTASGLLVSCTDGGPSADRKAPAGPARKGGTLTVAVISGGPSESMDPWDFATTPCHLRRPCLYDQLFEYDDDLNLRPALAEFAEVSVDKKTWTVRLRQGITFHDGSPLIADDLVYNVLAWTDPTVWGSSIGGNEIDPKRVSNLDDRTVRIGLRVTRPPGGPTPVSGFHYLSGWLARATTAYPRLCP